MKRSSLFFSVMLLTLSAVSASGQTNPDTLYVGTLGVHDPVDHEVIQDAVDAASSGDVILIWPGIYTDISQNNPLGVNACVFINKGISLSATGTMNPTAVRIDAQGVSGSVGIMCNDEPIDSDTIDIRLLSVTGADVGIKNLGDRIAVTNVVASSNQEAGMWIGAAPGEQGFSGTANIQNCAVSSNGGVGIVFFSEQGVAGQVKETVFANNGIGPPPVLLPADVYRGGIISDTPQLLIVQDCTFLDNVPQAVWFMGGQEGSEFQFESCRIGFTEEPGTLDGAGVRIDSQAQGSVRDCRIYWYRFGINAWNPGGLFLRNNSIMNCDEGMHIFNTIPVSVSQNLLVSNEFGVRAFGPVDASLAWNNFWENTTDFSGAIFESSTNYFLDPLFCVPLVYDLNDFGVREDSPMLVENGAPSPGIGSVDIGCQVPGGGGGSCTKNCPHQSDVYRGIAPTANAILGVSPNPFRAGSVVHFSTTEPSTPEVRIFDVEGRQIYTAVLPHHDPGVWMWSWDGRRDDGRNPAMGVYYLKLAVNANVMTRKLVKIR